VIIENVFAARVSISVTFLVLLLVSCVSDKMHMRLYAGPERPDEEIGRLLVPESLEVRSINGEFIPRIPRIVQSGDRRLDLLPGGYDVAVRYDEVWPINASEDEVVRSEPQLLSFELEAGQTIRLEHRRPIDLDDARRLAHDMKLTLVDLSRDEPTQLAVASRPAVVNTPLVVSPILPMENDANSKITPIAGAPPSRPCSRSAEVLVAAGLAARTRPIPRMDRGVSDAVLLGLRREGASDKRFSPCAMLGRTRMRCMIGRATRPILTRCRAVSFSVPPSGLYI